VSTSSATTAPAASGRTREISWRRGKDERSETLIEVEAPPDDRGTLYLSHSSKDRTRTWICLPELKRVRALAPGSTAGKLLCTDFSSEDIQHMQRITGSAHARRLPDGSLGGRSVQVVRSDTSAVEGASYHHLVYYVDSETCIPLRIEFFETDDALRKVLTTDPGSIVRSGEGWVAKHMTMKDLGNETSSKLRVKEIEVDAKMHQRLFRVSYLEQRCK
jgi:hypothetical protein